MKKFSLLVSNYLVTTALCALGLSSLSGCVSDVPPSSSDQGVVALFNPAVSPPVVPTPTDLVRVNGQLLIPVDPAEATNGALQTFNNYLRGLDGFPPDSVAGTTFSGDVDGSSLAEGVVIYDATAKQLLMSPAATASLNASSAKQLVISTQGRYQTGHTYFVGLFSWQDSGTQHGLKSADGKAVLSDAAFDYLRSATPLYAKCQDATNPACACATLTAIGCHSVVDGLNDAQAQQLEGAREELQPIISDVLQLQGRARSDLVFAWSFTISSRAFATFDISRSQAPFPSNLLLSNSGLGDPMADATVALPILPTDDAHTAALKTGLNTLDGFSTTGSVQFPIDSPVASGQPVDIDATTVVPGKTAFLLNLTTVNQQPAFKAAPLEALLDTTQGTQGFAGQIWVTPLRPLQSDRTNYVSVLTTGIKDANGQALVPSPTTLLLTQSSPLLNSDGSSAVSTLSAAQAGQLEFLRMSLAPLFTELASFGIKPETIAAFTVYRTQSIINPLAQLLGGTAQLAAVAGLLPTDVSISVTDTALPSGFSNLSAVIHGTMTVRRVVDLLGAFDTSRLAPDPSFNDVIPFVLTLPTKAAAPGGAPVVIAQHGLTRWRGDTLMATDALADALASKGLAMIAIDVIYHGGRVICLSNADCAAGVTCNQPSPVNGVPQAGKCAGGAYLVNPGAGSIPGITDQLPSTSLPNRDFTNLANPFAQRDNFRQHILDLFQLVRVIKDASATGLTAQVAANTTIASIDNTKIGYIGQSLGAILGTDFLAMSPSVNLGVLNVGGGDLVDIFTDPGSSLSAGVATALGVTPGTPAFYSLVENFRWIIDPADPINFGRYVRSPSALTMPTRNPAKVILQEAGMDTVILNPYTLALGIELGLPRDANQHLQGITLEGTTSQAPVSTYFSTADHGALFDGSAATPAVQDQAVTYLMTGLGGVAPTVK